jgi:hypothetical protein
MGKKRKIDIETTSDDRKPFVIQVRGSIEFGEAVRKLAESDGMSVSTLVDKAIRDYARSIGFTDPIPKR